MPPGSVFHIDINALPPQGSNTDLASVLDVVGGVPFSAGTAAKYWPAGGAGEGGRAFLRTSGTANYTCISADQGALKTAIDSQEYTIIVVAANVQASDSCCVFGQGGSGKTHMSADGAKVGVFGGLRVPFTGLSYVSFGTTSTKTSPYGGAGAGQLSRYYCRGLPYGSITSAGPTTNGATFGLLAAGNGLLKAKLDLYEIYVFNRALTQAEMLQVEFFLNARYGKTHPVTTKGKLLHIGGNSIQAGVGGTENAATRTPWVIANLLGYGPGEWACSAIGGITMANALANVSADMGHLTTMFPSVELRHTFEESYNQSNAGSPIGDLVTVNSMIWRLNGYYQAARTALGPSAKIVAQAPIDHTGAGLVGSAWYAALIAALPSMPVDGLADPWTKTALGGDNAAVNAAPWYDGLHLLGNGLHDATDGQFILGQAVANDCLAVSGF